MSENIKIEAPFTQVCVWPGTLVGADQVEAFKQFFLEEFKTRVQYLEEIVTLPDNDDKDNVVPESGGRNDVLFAVHSEDVGHFAVPRFQLSIRWIEDVLRNEQERIDEGKQARSIYPERFKSYTTW